MTPESLIGSSMVNPGIKINVFEIGKHKEKTNAYGTFKNNVMQIRGVRCIYFCNTMSEGVIKTAIFT